MDEPVLSLHIDDQLPPIRAFAAISDALRDLVAVLSEYAMPSDPPAWALYEIEHEWNGTTLEMHAALADEERDRCVVAPIADNWLDLARCLAQGEPLSCSASVADAVVRLRRVQREQDWILRFDHRCQRCREPVVVVPPYPVRLIERRGTIRGPVQVAYAGENPRLSVLDQATRSSVRCYLSPDHSLSVEDADQEFAAVTGTILEDADQGSPIAMYEISNVKLTPWDWVPLRDSIGMGRWDARDQAAARLIHDRRRSA